MSILTFTVINLEDESDYYDGNQPPDTPGLLFTCILSSGIILKFHAFTGADETMWRELAKSIYTSINHIVNWDPQDGECYIEISDGFITFCTVCYSAGGGCTFNIPTSKGIGDVFIRAAEMTEQWKDKYGIARAK